MARVTDTFPAAGVLADRPVDPGSVPAFYSASDTNLIYRWDGTTWTTWASGATDPEVVRDAIGNALVAGENITIAADDAGDTITISGAASGLWKGPWVSAPDEVVWTQDFGTDITPFTGDGVRTAMADAGGSAKPSGYGWVDQGSGTADHGSVHNIASLTLSDIPEMAGRTPTRIKFWQGLQAQGVAAIYRANIFEVLCNGAVQFTDSVATNGDLVQRPWVELDISASTLSDTLLWRMRDGMNTSSFYPTGTLAITGIRAYAAVVGWTGYKVDETVTYLGRLWRSTISDNMTTPGTAGASWAEVPLTPDSEAIRDVMGTALVAGTNVTIVVNDAGDTITISATDTNTTDPEVVRDTMAAALVAGANITITPDDTGDTITIAATGSGGGGSGLFRGEWESTPMTVAHTIDFADGLVAPLTATATSGSTANVTVVGYTGLSGGAIPTPPAKMLKVGLPALENSYLQANLNLNNVPVATPVAVRWWWASTGANGTPSFRKDDVQVDPTLTPSPQPWQQRTEAVNAGQSVAWRNFITTGNYTYLYVARIEILEADTGFAAYMTGEYVVYGGRMWRSDVDNNAAEPGVSGWTEVPLADPEVVRDTIGATLVAGANVTITPDDAGNTITIAAGTSGGGTVDAMAFKDLWVAGTYDKGAVVIQDNLLFVAKQAGVTSTPARPLNNYAQDFSSKPAESYWAYGTSVGNSIVSAPASAFAGTTTSASMLKIYGGGTNLSNPYAQVTLNFPTGGTITFKDAVSSETSDYCRFFIDNVQQYVFSGTVGWTARTFTVAAGTHTLKWRYDKDSSVSSGLDAYGITDLLCSGSVIGNTTDWGVLGWTDTGAEEAARDAVGKALVAGTGVKVTVNDGGDTITVAATGTKTLNTPTANYTLALADAGGFVRMNVATANTLTVPPNSAVAFPVGTTVEGVQAGAGQTTITPGAGVTINATPGLKTAAQYGTFGLLKVDTDTWLAYGRLSA